MELEKKLFSQGHNIVVGIDEVGRGAWAGPIVAGVVAITKDNFLHSKPHGVCDSKMLSPKKRQDAFCYIKNNFDYAIGIVDSSIIDMIGITAANQLAVDKALQALGREPSYILVDGRGFHFDQQNKNIINGDEKIFSISAASIAAKVIRDAMMEKWHEIYDVFGFYRHKGYGTKLHYDMIQKYGICSIHRRSFQPIRMLLYQ